MISFFFENPFVLQKMLLMFISFFSSLYLYWAAWLVFFWQPTPGLTENRIHYPYRGFASYMHTARFSLRLHGLDIFSEPQCTKIKIILIVCSFSPPWKTSYRAHIHKKCFSPVMKPNKPTTKIAHSITTVRYLFQVSCSRMWEFGSLFSPFRHHHDFPENRNKDKRMKNCGSVIILPPSTKEGI